MVLSMERWIGKVAIVTGASSGIGAAIAKQLTEIGMIVVGLARRKEKIEQLSKEIKNAKGQLHAVKCDVSKEEDILNAFKWVLEKLGPVHVLVNNAGIVEHTSLSDGDTKKWRRVIDVNVLGLCIATREAIRIMKSHKIDGHIVHMNSVTGHTIPSIATGTNVYPGTKHAVTALAEVLRFELLNTERSIKITSISPGATKTEIIDTSQITSAPINEAFMNIKILEAEDIADAVVYALSTPPHVQIKELTIKPVKEKF